MQKIEVEIQKKLHQPNNNTLLSEYSDAKRFTSNIIHKLTE